MAEAGKKNQKTTEIRSMSPSCTDSAVHSGRRQKTLQSPALPLNTSRQQNSWVRQCWFRQRGIWTGLFNFYKYCLTVFSYCLSSSQLCKDHNHLTLYVCFQSGFTEVTSQEQILLLEATCLVATWEMPFVSAPTTWDLDICYNPLWPWELCWYGCQFAYCHHDLIPQGQQWFWVLQVADAVSWYRQDETLSCQFCPGSRVVPDTGLPLVFTGLPYINTENQLTTALTFEHTPRSQVEETDHSWEILLENSTW